MNARDLVVNDSNDPRSVVERTWAALSRGDTEGMAMNFADDMVWRSMSLRDLLPYAGDFSGKVTIVNELLAMLKQVYDFNAFELEIRDIHTDGPIVVMEFTINATTALGRQYKNGFYAAVFKVVDGKINWIREYFDSLKIKAALFD